MPKRELVWHNDFIFIMIPPLLKIKESDKKLTVVSLSPINMFQQEEWMDVSSFSSNTFVNLLKLLKMRSLNAYACNQPIQFCTIKTNDIPHEKV